MLRFALATLLAISSTSLIQPMVANSQEGAVRKRTRQQGDTVKAPVFPEKFKGHVVMDAILDLSITQMLGGGDPFEAPLNDDGTPIADWQLEFVVKKDGGVLPGTTRLQIDPRSKTQGSEWVRIPKGIVLIGLELRANGQSCCGGNLIKASDDAEQVGPFTDDELDLMCGEDWIITWEEDANGNEIPGTSELYCGSVVVPWP
ncbi:MAG: hypothetical protein AAF664_03050 [Planctomycetota bacterium]